MVYGNASQKRMQLFLRQFVSFIEHKMTMCQLNENFL
jgi:hypothetical protein